MDQGSTVRFGSPFSTKDLFLYVIPGATAMLAVFLFEMRLNRAVAIADIKDVPLHLPLYHAANAIRSDPFSQGFVFGALVLTALLTMAYVAGHVISSVSSLFLDRVLLAKGHNYPFVYLLAESKRPRTETCSQAFYRGLFIWGNLWLLAYWCSHATSWPYMRGISRGLFWGLVVAPTILKIAVSFVNKSNQRLRVDDVPKVVGWGVRLYSAPFDLPANFFDKLVRAREPLEEAVVKRFEAQLVADFGMTVEASGSNAYWCAYLSIVTRSPQLARLVQTWLHLYEFARNLSTSFYLCAIYAGGLLAFQGQIVRQLNSSVVLWIPFGYAAVALILMSRYYYLFSCYYSRFIARVYAFIDVFAPAGQEGGKEPPLRLS